MRAVDAVLERAVERGDPPAAQCCVRSQGEVVYEGAFGCSLDSVFDVASVTKVAATTTALARFVAEGRCALDEPIGRFLPAAAFGEVSLRALLAHRSGLIAWRPMFLERPPRPPDFAASRRSVARQVLATAPTERGRVYSDLGFIALGLALEAIAGAPLDSLCAPLFEGDLGFVDLTGGRPSWLEGRHVLATGRTRPREPAPGQEALFDVPPQEPREDPGEVDDDHAYAMGGVAGHAGLFATAAALAAHMDEVWLDDRLELGPVREAFLTLDPLPSAKGDAAPPRALGFDVARGPGSSAGALAGDHVRGHLGFTGCSVWMDPARRLVVTLLTNRTLEGRHRVAGIRALRPAVHDAIAAALL